MKQINNYTNYYIDNQGNVYNSTTKSFLKGSIGENGYKYYRLSQNGSKKMFYAHRLVAEHYIDNPCNLPVVNHIDGDKLNNASTNLEWVSYSDNTKYWHKNNIQTRQATEYYNGDLDGETWVRYGNYLVSSMGRVRHGIKNNLLKPSNTCGYYKIRLSHNGLVEDHMVHQLVWRLFNGDILDENEIIDHIDGNKLNNNITNLRKLTLSENVKAALYEQHTNSSAKKVAQYTINGEFIQEFISVAEAARQLNLDSSTISKVCRGQNKTHGGFTFKYI